jgi:hypothetical protein
MIKIIKTIHTIIWIVMVASIFYILYAGITKTFNNILWFSISLIILEIMVLGINKWTCPLTPIAKKFTSNRDDNFDIYLPKIIAKHNKVIFSIIFIIGITLVILNIINK